MNIDFYDYDGDIQGNYFIEIIIIGGRSMFNKSIIAINKSDLGKHSLKNFDKKINPIIISIKDYDNVDKLIEAIKSKLKNQFLKTENVLITRSRHRLHLKECHKKLNRNKYIIF